MAEVTVPDAVSTARFDHREALHILRSRALNDVITAETRIQARENDIKHAESVIRDSIQSIAFYHEQVAIFDREIARLEAF